MPVVLRMNVEEERLQDTPQELNNSENCCLKFVYFALAGPRRGCKAASRLHHNPYDVLALNISVVVPYIIEYCHHSRVSNNPRP